MAALKQEVRYSYRRHNTIVIRLIVARHSWGENSEALFAGPAAVSFTQGVHVLQWPVILQVASQDPDCRGQLTLPQLAQRCRELGSRA